MHNPYFNLNRGEEYESHNTAIQKILNKSMNEISTDESTIEYGKSLEKIAKDRQLKQLTRKDRETLVKIAALLKKEVKEVEEEIQGTVSGDIADNPKPFKMTKKEKEDFEESVNEVKTNKFTLNDMDDNDAAVVIAMAKKAGVFLRSKKVSMKRSDVELKGDKKKLFKFINSLPESTEVNEKLEKGPIDGRTLAGKIITGEVKLLTVKQGSPGRRGQTYIMATGRPSIMGAPPESIYIDATGARPRGSGLAIGFEIDQIKKAEILRDGSARVELK